MRKAEVKRLQTKLVGRRVSGLDKDEDCNTLNIHRQGLLLTHTP